MSRFAALWYNLALSVYYVLVIRYGWKEFQVKRAAKYLHAFALVIGFGLGKSQAETFGKT